MTDVLAVKVQIIEKALYVIDCYLSGILMTRGRPVRRQRCTIEEAREIHSKIILYFKQETVDAFNGVMFGLGIGPTIEQTPLVEKLDALRNAFRKELGMPPLFNKTEWLCDGIFFK